ncbi:hypothetical protein ACN077_23885 [Clostridium chromiireducens]|uniref:hypothetical protein n=1 Tax=Clostridium chromiireducens TaxID=225345 RepID=UPI003AF468AF
MNVPIKKSKRKDKFKYNFCTDEDESVEIIGFSEGEAKIEGTLLKSFSFDSDDELVEEPIISPDSSIAAAGAFNISETSNKLADNNTMVETNISYNDSSSEFTKNEVSLPHNKSSIKSEPKKEVLDHRTLKANPSGRTPPVDGEIYDMVRTYTLRRSTVRILSKIKAIHSNDNVYLNTIVDEAIRYYYEYLKSMDT